MNEIIIVRQDKGAPLLHLQAVLATGDSLAAVHLGGLEVLRTQPGLIHRLGERQRGEKILMSKGKLLYLRAHTRTQFHTMFLHHHDLYSF